MKLLPFLILALAGCGKQAVGTYVPEQLYQCGTQTLRIPARVIPPGRTESITANGWPCVPCGGCGVHGMIIVAAPPSNDMGEIFVTLPDNNPAALQKAIDECPAGQWIQMPGPVACECDQSIHGRLGVTKVLLTGETDAVIAGGASENMIWMGDISPSQLESFCASGLAPGRSFIDHGFRGMKTLARETRETRERQ